MNHYFLATRDSIRNFTFSEMLKKILDKCNLFSENYICMFDLKIIKIWTFDILLKCQIYCEIYEKIRFYKDIEKIWLLIKRAMLPAALKDDKSNSLKIIR